MGKTVGEFEGTSTKLPSVAQLMTKYVCGMLTGVMTTRSSLMVMQTFVRWLVMMTMIMMVLSITVCCAHTHIRLNLKVDKEI